MRCNTAVLEMMMELASFRSLIVNAGNSNSFINVVSSEYIYDYYLMFVVFV